MHNIFVVSSRKHGKRCGKEIGIKKHIKRIFEGSKRSSRKLFGSSEISNKE